MNFAELRLATQKMALSCLLCIIYLLSSMLHLSFAGLPVLVTVSDSQSKTGSLYRPKSCNLPIHILWKRLLGKLNNKDGEFIRTVSLFIFIVFYLFINFFSLKMNDKATCSNDSVSCGFHNHCA